MFEAYPSLLVTKLYSPRLRPSHIARPSLLAALEAGLQAKLILIAAAAGFGKTSLLAEWCRQHAEQVCWVSLDESDNDPTRFLSYLVAAIQLSRPAIGAELLAALQSPQPPHPQNALHSLVNQLATEDDRLIIVFDDYHVIENNDIHAAITFLLDYLPPQITLVMLTRTDPPLPISRLRANNELVEIRAAGLRFSVDEAAQFLNYTSGLDLSPQTIEALDARTEGWIVGLQLAAIALQSIDDDRENFVQEFTGSHRFVLDYLIEEVLSQQNPEVRRFLLQTAILRRLNADLCSAVTGEDGYAMLAFLESHHLFLVPLDQTRYWYRYHHLFADLLQARLHAEYAGEIPVLYQRAAVWHAENNSPEEAIFYALAARDFVYAADLITSDMLQVSRRGDTLTLLEWYRAFPPEFVREHPRLCLQFGLAFGLNGRWDDAEMLLGYVEQADSNDTFPISEKLLLAYLVANYRGDAEHLARIADEASRQPDRLSQMVLGILLSVRGDLQEACDLLAEVQEASQRAGDMTLALTALFHQCRLHVFAGNLQRAHDLSQQALAYIQQIGAAALPMASLPHVSLVRVFIEWNQPEQAAYHAEQTIHLCERSGFVTGMLSSTTMMLAEIQQAQGNPDEATHTAENALVYAERYDPAPEVAWLKTYQARVWLTQGNISAASTWLDSWQSLPLSMFYPTTIQLVTQARVWLAQRKTDTVIASLTKLLEAPPNLLTVEAMGMLALARMGRGDSVNALLTLEQAFALAEPENRIRTFLDLGYSMAKLIARFLEDHPNHTFARRVLAAFPDMLDTAPDPLSERELEVLRLIVAGYSNDEIAGELTVAVSTVKWYINGLYGKLHVKTRSQAIARAHELHLLGD